MSERTQTHATFVLERYYPVPVDRVWDAFADPEMKRQWFGSGDFVEQERREDFRVGGVAIHDARHGKGGPLSQFRATYSKNPADAVKLLHVGESKLDHSIPAPELAAWMLVSSTALNLDAVINK